MAECSESTGTISAPHSLARRMTMSPAHTSVSLLASAMRRPFFDNAASVGRRPTAPDTAVTWRRPCIRVRKSTAASHTERFPRCRRQCPCRRARCAALWPLSHPSRRRTPGAGDVPAAALRRAECCGSSSARAETLRPQMLRDGNGLAADAPVAPQVCARVAPEGDDERQKTRARARRSRHA